MRNTAIKRPQTRNHLLAFCFIVERTSALMIALSMLEIISKRERPRIVRMIERIFI